jgi:hypothetical protein
VSAAEPAGGTTQGPAEVRYVRDVTPADVGVRVTLRRRSADGSVRDTLGVLESWDDGRLHVRRRDGSVVVVDEGDVLALKRVPPPPVRRR